MFVNSYSRYSSCLSPHLYSQHTECIKSLKNRFTNIDNKLIELYEDEDHFKKMSDIYGLFVFQNSSNSNKFACVRTARAIVVENIFNQSRYQKLESIKKLFRALTDNEEGTFFLNIFGSKFINQDNETRVFHGHAFTILKVIEEGKTGYLLAQSYAGKYSLKVFVNKADRCFLDFSDLKEKILRPYVSLLYKEGPWTEKECQAYLAITGIYLENMIGFYPNSKIFPEGRLHEWATFGRTTDKASGYELRMNHISYFVVQRLRNAHNPNWKLSMVAAIQPPVSQALYQRFEVIDNELKKMISIDGRMAQLAKTYYKMMYGEDVKIIKENSNCQDTAFAIFQANLSNYTNIQRLSPQNLDVALTDSEEGTFMIEIYADDFINSKNQKRLFPGHTFIIDKVIEGSEIGYRFIHSCVNQLKLIDFLESKSNRYDDYNALKRHILEPVYSLLEKKGPWTEEESQNFFLISSMYLMDLEGYFHPSGNLAFDITRTTNSSKEYCLLDVCDISLEKVETHRE